MSLAGPRPSRRSALKTLDGREEESHADEEERPPDVVEDAALLAWARALAPVMLDQHLALAAKHVQRWLGGKAEFLKA